MLELASTSKIDEHGKPKVVISCLNPGFCQTALVKPERTVERVGVHFAKVLLARKAEEGRMTIVHGAAAGSRTTANISLIVKFKVSQCPDLNNCLFH
jgi:hypothetical protein